MWRKTILPAALVAFVLACLVAANTTVACGGYIDEDQLAIDALSDKPEVAKRAARMLRVLGPKGLDVLMNAHAAAIERHRANPAKTEPMWERLSAALDAVAAQKDAWAAGLYWYTDLEQAKSVAAKQNKPILSLRLLGTLDTEFSCANSRFFRTVLYADANVREHLKGNFVLHWQSHRPVPKLTIDFGDGRKIERTITGNSAHYVLTPAGKVVDVLPGLYGPRAFLTGLYNAQGIAQHHQAVNFEALLTRYHRNRSEVVRTQWTADLRRVNLALAPRLDQLAAAARKPTGAEAARIAVSKAAVELRPVLAIAPERDALASTMNDQLWAQIAALHADQARLDPGSRAVIVSKSLPVPDAVEAGERARAKRVAEDPLARMIRNLERSVAEDTVRNEYTLHAQVHEWFATGQVPAKLDDLNERVYAELFLMPKSDPWLGLVPADTYTGLPSGATVTSATR